VTASPTTSAFRSARSGRSANLALTRSYRVRRSGVGDAAARPDGLPPQAPIATQATDSEKARAGFLMHRLREGIRFGFRDYVAAFFVALTAGRFDALAAFSISATIAAR